MKTSSPQRVATVNIFRALTTFLVLFVNDIPGFRNTPHWLGYAAMTEGMLDFPDTILLTFLFCMGMSISFAVQNRYQKGDSLLQVVMHTFWRTVALVVMGLFSVNSGGVAGLSHPWFSIIMVIGFFLIWGVYPKSIITREKYLYAGMRTVDILLLTFLILYKGLHGAPLRQKWWGILGLIGWTYVICASIYLFTRESLVRNLFAWVLFIILALLNHADVLPFPSIPSDTTLHTFGISGVLISLLVQKYASPERPGKFIGTLCGLGLLMLTIGFASHPFWIISEIQATPSWFFFCTAAFFPPFGSFYWLTDIKGKTCWFDIIKPAGTVTLTYYIIPYIWYVIQQLFGLHYPTALDSGIPGLMKSATFSLIIVGITGLLVKAKIKLKV